MVRARLTSLTQIRRWLNRILLRCGAAESTRSDLALAVTELCSNIIRHGYRGADGTIDISAASDSHAFEVTVVDQAPCFAPAATATTETRGALREGGFGIPLIRALVDEVSHESLGARGNRVRLVRYRKAGDHK